MEREKREKEEGLEGEREQQGRDKGRACRTKGKGRGGARRKTGGRDVRNGKVGKE